MKKNELHIKTEFSGSRAELQLSGALSIQHAKRIKEALVEALGRQVPVVITCNNIAQLDLPVLQLFIAATKTAAQSITKITFDIDLPAPLQSILQHAGMDEPISQLNEHR